MIREEFFPTSVYGKDINLDNDRLAQNIIDWSNQDQGVQKTNYKGWHSTTDMANKGEYQLLVNELNIMCKEVFNEEWLDREPVLGNMWANINPKDGMNQPHIHPNSLFSGVYYVKSNPNAGRLKIYDPRPGIQMVMPIRKDGKPPKHLWRDANLDPITGRIIIFPAWLWHSVEPNQSNDLRISVSFNFIQYGF
tara:strand:- start:399 stop:977 length:579 start_codon:yes stop_codon:yes gene_type:complete